MHFDSANTFASLNLPHRRYFWSRLRCEISRLRLRFLAGWDLPMLTSLPITQSEFWGARVSALPINRRLWSILDYGNVDSRNFRRIPCTLLCSSSPYFLSCIPLSGVSCECTKHGSVQSDDCTSRLHQLGLSWIYHAALALKAPIHMVMLVHCEAFVHY